LLAARESCIGRDVLGKTNGRVQLERGEKNTIQFIGAETVGRREDGLKEMDFDVVGHEGRGEDEVLVGGTKIEQCGSGGVGSLGFHLKNGENLKMEHRKVRMQKKPSFKLGSKNRWAEFGSEG